MQERGRLVHMGLEVLNASGQNVLFLELDFQVQISVSLY